MLKAVRHKKIQEMLMSGGQVTVAELAEKFSTSPITIRRDLEYLDQQGLLNRTHGGAVADFGDGSPASTKNYSVRESAQAAQKQLIARHAARLITDGESIIMNGGTSMHALAMELSRHNNLQVVTNGLTVAVELGGNSTTRVYFIGGMVDFTKMATVGHSAQEVMKDIHVDRAFLGVSGISVSGGLAMFNPHEAEINRAFINAAREVTILVDSTKFSSKAMFRIAPIEKVHRLITDAGIDPDVQREIARLGIEVVIAR